MTEKITRNRCQGDTVVPVAQTSFHASVPAQTPCRIAPVLIAVAATEVIASKTVNGRQRDGGMGCPRVEGLLGEISHRQTPFLHRMPA